MSVVSLLVGVLLVGAVGVASAALLRGGPGGDTLTGTSRADSFYGRSGDDRLSGRGGNDDLDGGPGADDQRGGRGRDAATYGGRSAPVTVTVDNRADDGQAGEDDNVRTDVEDVYGGRGNDALTGSARSNTLDGQGGDDLLVGGVGEDFLYGGRGDDGIDARDGRVDLIDCGPGVDKVHKDRRDSARGCERRGRVRPLPSKRATGRIPFFWRFNAAATRAEDLRVFEVSPVPATVQLRCRGSGCPLKKKTVKVKRAGQEIDFTRALKRRPLKVGALVEIRITAPDRLGKYLGFRMRRSTLPKLIRRCLEPGISRPIRCP